MPAPMKVQPAAAHGRHEEHHHGQRARNGRVAVRAAPPHGLLEAAGLTAELYGLLAEPVRLVDQQLDLLPPRQHLVCVCVLGLVV